MFLPIPFQLGALNTSTHLHGVYKCKHSRIWRVHNKWLTLKSLTYVVYLTLHKNFVVEVGTDFSRVTLNCVSCETVRSTFHTPLPLSLNIHRALHQKRQTSVNKILICYMNSVLVAEHHKILETDILWEMCVCIIVDYIVIHPLFGYEFISCRQSWFCIT